MIGWERPPLDELGCSNGTFVYGYRVRGTHTKKTSQTLTWKNVVFFPYKKRCFFLLNSAGVYRWRVPQICHELSLHQGTRTVSLFLLQREIESLKKKTKQQLFFCFFSSVLQRTSTSAARSTSVYKHWDPTVWFRAASTPRTGAARRHWPTNISQLCGLVQQVRLLTLYHFNVLFILGLHSRESIYYSII